YYITHSIICQEVFEKNMKKANRPCHLERNTARDPKPYAYASGSTGALAPALRMTRGGVQSKPAGLPQAGSRANGAQKSHPFGGF
ncbi:MAG: hypothetical protein IJD35_06715, partial [Clostridia bacterium]|nr:hypothetical protein [Clostridia bacterium]